LETSPPRLLTELPFKPPELKTSPSSSSLFDDASKRLVLSSLSPPSPLYEDEFPQNSPTFFVDANTKVRNLSSEIFQCASDSLARGYATDPSKMEYLATELLKLSRQLNNTGGDDDERRRQDSKILPPPLVRPRRIRRKHNEEEDAEDGDKKRKLGTGSELYCHSCGTTDTPEWRRGPDGCKSLCNACGLHYAKILRRETMIPNRQPGRTSMGVNNLLNYGNVASQ